MTSEKDFDFSSQCALFELYDCGVMVYDADYIVVYANKKIEEYFMVHRDHIQGKNITSFFSFLKVDNLITAVEGEDNFFRCNGAFYNVVKLKLPQKEGLQCALIIKSNSAKNTAINLENELRNIMESFYDGIYVTNENGVTIWVNRTWEMMSNVNRDEVIGKSVLDLKRNGYFSKSAIMSAIQKQKAITTLDINKAGKTILKTAVPVYDNNKLWRVVQCVRDVSLLNQARQKQEKGNKTGTVNNHEIVDNVVPGASKEYENAIGMAFKAAKVDLNILILGETGAGKSLLAKMIHSKSHRSNGPFVVVNCGALPESLLESELFGYERGAFTGARSEGKKGLIEIANQGTLFLDEISEIPLNMQVKLLHVIEERKMIRVGGTKPINLDLRLIAASNRDLESMVAGGLFRADLYYRLNVIQIPIPPLREREEDIPTFVRVFLERANNTYGVYKEFSQEALRLLTLYNWPGNIRELQNVVESLIVTAPNRIVDVGDLPAKIRQAGEEKNCLVKEKAASIKDVTHHVERELILKTLAESKSIRQCADKLGIAHSSLLRKIKIHQISYEKCKK